eukprot:gi/632987742/ref/XP_007882724.1/ PREDICTED: SH3 domain-binding protein 1-like [Callorhinchus milii]
MMKKQLNRMLQLANHSIGRSETTELLSEDLVQYENRIEPTKRAMYNAHRRLLACLQGQQGSDLEKRLKKMPLMSLSHVMEDSCRELDTASSIRKILEVCCFIESTLAKVLAEHELQVEKDVLDPLFKLSEDELPNILKHKKQLAKVTLDWTGAKNRLSQATKSGGPGASTPCAGAKVDVLREEADEAWRKVEQSKDEYAADLYHFASKEEEYANYFLSLLEAQADYHRKSLKVLDTLMPGLKSAPNAAERNGRQAAFGKPLQEHLESCQRQIALPIEACVMMLLEKGMKEEGLFRLAPAASVLKQLKSSLDSGAFNPEEFKYDPHAVAGALKSYLRELPHPLMTFNLYDEWFEAASEKDQETKVERLRDVCNKLPEGNYSNLRYLIKFLARLAEDQDVNKMSPSNIAIVLGPNLLWPQNEGIVSLADMASASSVQVVSVMEPIILNANKIFPGDLDFNVSGAFVPGGPGPSECSPALEQEEKASPEPTQVPPTIANTTPPGPKKETSTQAQSETLPVAPASSPAPSREVGQPQHQPLQRSSSQAPASVVQAPIIVTSHSVKKGRRPTPARPTFPPPLNPRASLYSGLEEPRPMTRNLRGSSMPLRVPSMPPPRPPTSYQRTGSMGEQVRGGEAGLPNRRTSGPDDGVSLAATPPQSFKVDWNKRPEPRPRSRLLSASKSNNPVGTTVLCEHEEEFTSTEESND